MTLRVYNTLKREVEAFVPIRGKKVGLYVCGITPYDASHLGHARCYVTWDVFRRYLEFSGFDVTHIQNFTDVDDKIIHRANELKRNPSDLAQEYIDAYFEEFDQLNVKRAHQYPKVTAHIPEIIVLVKKLIQNGFAYENKGDVFFEVKKCADYGKLSRQSVDDLVKGKRIEPSENKKNPEDFALWKAAKPGEPSWESPWGKGRPGWHIECSVMSSKYLGEQFDAHGGGQDLIFPHHENEIAQSESASGKKPFVKYWLHNGFVTVKQDKMAKSLGNFLTVREALAKHSPETLRFFLISTHYRQPLDFNENALLQAKQAWGSLENALERMEEAVEEIAGNGKEEVKRKNSFSGAVDPKVEELVLGFTRAMDDDVNTPLAIALLFQLRDYAFKLLEQHAQNPDEDTKSSLVQCRTALSRLLDVLGFKPVQKELSIPVEEIRRLVEEREEARKQRDFGRADKIRRQLRERGVELEDQKDGSVRWKAIQ